MFSSETLTNTNICLDQFVAVTAQMCLRCRKDWIGKHWFGKVWIGKDFEKT